VCAVELGGYSGPTIWAASAMRRSAHACRRHRRRRHPRRDCPRLPRRLLVVEPAGSRGSAREAGSNQSPRRPETTATAATVSALHHSETITKFIQVRFYTQKRTWKIRYIIWQKDYKKCGMSIKIRNF
jgi:hypothetical protein